MTREFGNHFWKATYLSVLFLIQQTPFMIVQCLMSSVQDSNGFGNLGFVVLSVLYFF
jgi:hypothetical protein